MKSIGRNDPCPCGSGKKYKQCCLSEDDARDFQYRRQLNVGNDLNHRLIEFALNLHDPETVEEAWHDFNDAEDVEMISPDSPMNVIFIPWFLFTWVFDISEAESEEFEGSTNAMAFAVAHSKELSLEEWAYLEAADTARYSLYEVIQTKPGQGMVLRDLFLQDSFELLEHLASESLHPGQIIYSATMDLDGVKSNLAMAPYALRPTTKRDVVELRKVFLKALRKKKLTEEHLVTFEEDIRTLYLNKVDEMLSPPRLVNADQEPILFHKIFFHLTSIDEAFHRLKNLASNSSEEELLKDAEIKDNQIVNVAIPWTVGSKDDGGTILLAQLRLTVDELVAEVNSSERAETVRQLIEQRLGDLVRYKTTLIEPIESAIDEMWEAAAASSSTHELPNTKYKDQRTSHTQSFDPDDPEVRQLLQKLAKEHWETWYDIPVPALNDMTPREAARSVEGRDLLNSLLLEYEINNMSGDEFLHADIPALRRELGLD